MQTVTLFCTSSWLKTIHVCCFKSLIEGTLSIEPRDVSSNYPDCCSHLGRGGGHARPHLISWLTLATACSQLSIGCALSTRRFVYCRHVSLHGRARLPDFPCNPARLERLEIGPNLATLGGDTLSVRELIGGSGLGVWV